MQYFPKTWVVTNKIINNLLYKDKNLGKHQLNKFYIQEIRNRSHRFKRIRQKMCKDNTTKDTMYITHVRSSFVTALLVLKCFRITKLPSVKLNIN